jgi:CRP-like cAMP-binding protein
MLTIMERADHLQNAAIFARVPTQSLARLAAIAQEVRFEPGQTLYRMDEPPREMFVLLEGEVRLAGSTPGGSLKRYQAAGALSLLSDQPHSESARADGPAWALRISQQDLYDAMAEENSISRGIMQTLAAMLVQGR